MSTMKIADKEVGGDNPCFVVAEIGINHNGDLKTAIKMIDDAFAAGADAVKFQKRTPEVCVPKDQWGLMRDTPWGYIEYIKYRKLIEFEKREYDIINDHCAELGIPWFVSVWDEPSITFMEENYEPPAYKIPSAMLTSGTLLDAVTLTGRPIIMSTGMSTEKEIKTFVLRHYPELAVLHCNSTYPAQPKYLNLNMIKTLKEWFPTKVIGYSGHEVGLVPSVVAVALGAKIVERHFTLDRAMWDGKKVVYQEEKIARTKLRGDV
jgi:N-acetylneuraminate synthase